MALQVSPYTWRVIISGTYTTAAAATTAKNNITSAVAAYNNIAPRAGRFPAGITQPTTTQVAVSYETDDETEAKNLSASLTSSMTTTNRSNVVAAMYRGNTA